MLRSRHHVEEGRGDRRSIVLTEIPYQVGKNGLVEKIAEAAKDKRIEGVSDIRDESNREGVRIVIDLKRDATPDVVLNQLWRHTPAQSSLPGEHARDPRRQARDADAARLHRGVHPLPRGSDHASLEVRAAQGPRTRPHLARSRRRRHQPRRSGEADPQLGEPRRSSRKAARPRMGRRPDPTLHPAGRSGRAAGRRRGLQAVRSPGEGDPRASPPPSHGTWPRRDRERARRPRQEHRRIARNSRQPRSPLRGDA